jgi:hypothetical protein
MQMDPDFSGLIQVGVSEQPDEEAKIDQEQTYKEIRISNSKQRALMSSEYEYLKRDPEEEFFMLAVLSLKMVHNEEYDEAEYVY